MRVFVAPEQGLAAEHLAARGTRILSISVLRVHMILQFAGVSEDPDPVGSRDFRPNESGFFFTGSGF